VRKAPPPHKGEQRSTAAGGTPISLCPSSSWVLTVEPPSRENLIPTAPNTGWQGDTNAPVRDRRPHSSPRAVPGQAQPHVLGDTQHQDSATRFLGSPHRQGTLPGVQSSLWSAGKSIWKLHGTYCGMSRGSNEDGKSHGWRWFGEEQAWENKGRRGEKKPVLCNRHRSGCLMSVGCQQLLVKLDV